eukprot:8538100-Alexandrium_andersonii.AAC.1
MSLLGPVFLQMWWCVPGGPRPDVWMRGRRLMQEWVGFRPACAFGVREPVGALARPVGEVAKRRKATRPTNFCDT